MVVGPDFTRGAEPEHFDEIDALLGGDAFDRPDAIELVHRLRSDGDMWFELAKPWQGVIAGYAAFSQMRAPKGWACLDPLAVLPRFQNAAAALNESLRSYYAIGTRIVRETALNMIDSQHLLDQGIDVPSTVVVSGKPSFFQRAGFDLERARKLVSPYPVEHTLISRPGEDVPAEQLVYPPTFDDFDLTLGTLPVVS